MSAGPVTDAVPDVDVLPACDGQCVQQCTDHRQRHRPVRPGVGRVRGVEVQPGQRVRGEHPVGVAHRDRPAEQPVLRLVDTGLDREHQAVPPPSGHRGPDPARDRRYPSPSSDPAPAPASGAGSGFEAQAQAGRLVHEEEVAGGAVVQQLPGQQGDLPVQLDAELTACGRGHAELEPGGPRIVGQRGQSGVQEHPSGAGQCGRLVRRAGLVLRAPHGVQHPGAVPEEGGQRQLLAVEPDPGAVDVGREAGFRRHEGRRGQLLHGSSLRASDRHGRMASRRR